MDLRVVRVAALVVHLAIFGCSSQPVSGSRAASGNSSGGSGGTAAPAGGAAAETAGSAAVAGTDDRPGSGGTHSGGAESGGTHSGGAQPGGAGPAPLAGAGGASTGGASTGGASTASAGAASTVADGPLLAFPTAQGFGKQATGGRDGIVYHVTNLDDSGAGSFRDAVSGSGRIVVFDVGGYIELKSAVSVKSNLTIAGQTAPGGGIGFRGGEISLANSSNVICRYLRIRPGSETASTDDDALSLFRAHNVMIDHCSFEFGPWNNIDAVSDDWQAHPMTDITVQDSLIADPTGQQFGAHTESVSSRMAWYRNVFANSHNRNPLAKVDTVFVNNVLYNCSAGYTTHTSTAFQHDIVNNYFIFGPASTGTDNTWFQIDQNQAIYYSGNLKDTNLDGVLNGAATTPFWYQGPGSILSSAWSAETTQTASLDTPSAARVATSLAGALPHDPLDALILGQVMTLGRGPSGLGASTAGPGGDLYTSQAQTGLPNNGYGAISSGTKGTDSDGDGMPDAWENANGSDPHADDAMKKAASGYTLLERYLNWLAVPHATVSPSGADIDLSVYTSGFSRVSPSYAVSRAQNGSVSLSSDNHGGRFEPSPGFQGLGSFSFSVTGMDGTSYTSRVLVLTTP